MDSIKKEVRKLLMAGLGAAAEGVEKGDALLEKLAEKGEETLKQGKIKNEELKRTVKEALKGDKEADSVFESVKKMSAEQIQALKARIEEVEQGLDAEEPEDGEAAVAEAEEAAEEPVAEDLNEEADAEEAAEEDK